MIDPSPQRWAPWPAFDDEQVAAAADVLRSGRVNYWTGDQGREFEREFAEYTGVAHAVFVANGTVGLEAALDALRLPPGAEVITTPRTFIASSSAIVRSGLTPVFADVDRNSGNITAESIERVRTDRTAAVVVVHLGGWPADLAALRALCDRHGLALVEDCSQAHGARVDGAHVGTVGDVAVWSFCQDKIVTTGGEGGMVATGDADLWQRMWSWKDHGKSWSAVYERAHPPGFRWLHESFGTNGRGTEVQAAIGRLQYRRLDAWHEERTRNALALADAIADVPGIRVPLPVAGRTHAYYRQYAYLDLTSLAPGWTRDLVLAEASALLPVPLQTGSCSEIYRERAFEGSPSTPRERLPVARELGETAVAFPVHPGLEIAEMTAMAQAVAVAVDRAMRESRP